ncbi:hypothetical protein [Hymenobacter sp. HSC-4F20]|nr:hypothetical protein [Hymenobacter sp. HSC-4F20]
MNSSLPLLALSLLGALTLPESGLPQPATDSNLLAPRPEAPGQG